MPGRPIWQVLASSTWLRAYTHETKSASNELSTDFHTCIYLRRLKRSKEINWTNRNGWPSRATAETERRKRKGTRFVCLRGGTRHTSGSGREGDYGRFPWFFFFQVLTNFCGHLQYVVLKSSCVLQRLLFRQTSYRIDRIRERANWISWTEQSPEGDRWYIALV